MDELVASESWPEVLFITGVLGGGAAWLGGRAIAATWRPYWHVLGYMALLGAAVRFIHFALFDATLVAPLSYVADTAWLLAIGSLAWRMTRTRQMVRQYPWLYEQASPLTWRERSGTPRQNAVKPG
jgi:hypothetical protein